MEKQFVFGNETTLIEALAEISQNGSIDAEILNIKFANGMTYMLVNQIEESE